MSTGTPKTSGAVGSPAASACSAGERFATDLKAYVDGELPGLRRAAVRRHLDACAACRGEAEAMRVTARLFQEAGRSAPAEAAVSPALRARLIDTMQTEGAEPAPRRPLSFWRSRPAAVFGTAGAVLAAAGVAFLGMYTSLLPTAGRQTDATATAESAPATAAPAAPAAEAAAGAVAADAPAVAGRPVLLEEPKVAAKAAPPLRGQAPGSIGQDKVPEPQASTPSRFPTLGQSEADAEKPPITVRAPQAPVGAAAPAPRPAVAPRMSASRRSEPSSPVAKARTANASAQVQLYSESHGPREQAKKATPEPEHSPHEREAGAAASEPAASAAGAPAIVSAAPAPAVPPAPASLGGFGGGRGVAAAAPSTSSNPRLARQVHRQATLGVVVEDVEPAAGKVEQIVAGVGAGAFVASKEISDGPDGVRRAVFTLRVPSRDLDAVLRQVGALGRVEAKSDRSEDVTEEFNDALRDAAAFTSGARGPEARRLRADEGGAGARQGTGGSKESADSAALMVQQVQAQTRLETLRKKGELATLRVRLREQNVPKAEGGGPAAPPPAPPQTQTTG